MQLLLIQLERGQEEWKSWGLQQSRFGVSPPKSDVELVIRSFCQDVVVACIDALKTRAGSCNGIIELVKVNTPGVHAIHFCETGLRPEELLRIFDDEYWADDCGPSRLPPIAFTELSETASILRGANPNGFRGMIAVIEVLQLIEIVKKRWWIGDEGVGSQNAIELFCKAGDSPRVQHGDNVNESLILVASY